MCITLHCTSTSFHSIATHSNSESFIPTCVLTGCFLAPVFSYIWYQSSVPHSRELPHCIPHARNSHRSHRISVFLLQLLQNSASLSFQHPGACFRIFDAGTFVWRPSSISAQLPRAVTGLFQPCSRSNLPKSAAHHSSTARG